MKNITLYFSILFFLSCSNDKTENNGIDNPTSTGGISTEIIDTIATSPKVEKSKSGNYIEYYPNEKDIKFKGKKDKEGNRHGKWLFLSPEGKELSMTMFEHGKKHGHSIVHHPNGAIYYYGEYDMDKKVGIWKTFDNTGASTGETNYDEVNTDKVMTTY